MYTQRGFKMRPQSLGHHVHVFNHLPDKFGLALFHMKILTPHCENNLAYNGPKRLSSPCVKVGRTEVARYSVGVFCGARAASGECVRYVHQTSPLSTHQLSSAYRVLYPYRRLVCFGPLLCGIV